MAARQAVDRARRTGVRVTNPYDYARAFNYSPSADDREWLAEHAEQSPALDGRATVLDPTAGGGSVPFEAPEAWMGHPRQRPESGRRIGHARDSRMARDAVGECPAGVPGSRWALARAGREQAERPVRADRSPSAKRCDLPVGAVGHLPVLRRARSPYRPTGELHRTEPASAWTRISVTAPVRRVASAPLTSSHRRAVSPQARSRAATESAPIPIVVG